MPIRQLLSISVVAVVGPKLVTVDDDGYHSVIGPPARVDGVGQYVEMLGRKPEEVDLLLKELLIGVTHFFRDPAAFQTLAREVIPKLFEGKSANGFVRASIVGSASGEEAYSIAMLLCEHASTLDPTPSIQIFATDIDERGLNIARKGDG